jgi:hypothetical protein
MPCSFEGLLIIRQDYVREAKYRMKVMREEMRKEIDLFNTAPLAAQHDIRNTRLSIRQFY